MNSGKVDAICGEPVKPVFQAIGQLECEVSILAAQLDSVINRLGTILDHRTGSGSDVPNKGQSHACELESQISAIYSRVSELNDRLRSVNDCLCI